MKDWTPEIEKLAAELDLLLKRRKPTNTFEIVPTKFFWKVRVLNEQTKQAFDIECRTEMEVVRLTQAFRQVGIKEVT